MRVLRAVVGIGLFPILIMLSTVSASDDSTQLPQLTIDDVYVQVGEKTPEFAGFYYDDDGRPTVSLVGSTDAVGAKKRLSTSPSDRAMLRETMSRSFRQDTPLYN